MKKLLTAAVVLMAFVTNTYAQKLTDTVEFKKYLGKVATLCDTVSTARKFNDTLTLINMGGSYPHQKFTVAIKGGQIKLDVSKLKGKHLCVTGVLTLFKDKLEIVATEEKQITIDN